MSVFSGPQIPISGLYFVFDMGNPEESWKGKPTINVVANNVPTAGWGVSNFLTSSANRSFVTEDNVPYMKIDNVTNNTGYPRLTDVNFTANVTDGFSVSYEARGTPNAQIGLNIYAAGSTKSSSVANLTPSWQRYTFNNISTGFSLDQPYFQPVTSNAVYDIRRIQIEQSTFATPYVNGTRSNSQAILDITGVNTITAPNLTYNSNGTFSFNGTTDVLNGSANCQITGSVTLNAVIKPIYSTGAHKTVICTDIAANKGVKLMNYKNSARYGLWVGQGAGSYEAFVSANINDNVTKMLTGVWNSATGFVTMYINGVQTGNINTSNTAPTQLSDGVIRVGTDYWSDSNNIRYQGEIPYAAVYNRALSADEVLRTYNALKGRFGI